MENKDQQCTVDFLPDNSVPICGLHRKLLTEQTLETANQNPPGLGHLTPYICPVTEQTIWKVKGF